MIPLLACQRCTTSACILTNTKVKTYIKAREGEQGAVALEGTRRCSSLAIVTPPSLTSAVLALGVERGDPDLLAVDARCGIFVDDGAYDRIDPTAGAAKCVDLLDKWCVSCPSLPTDYLGDQHMCVALHTRRCLLCVSLSRPSQALLPRRSPSHFCKDRSRLVARTITACKAHWSPRACPVCNRSSCDVKKHMSASQCSAHSANCANWLVSHDLQEMRR